MKVRLAIDPADRPLALETDGTLWLAKAAPRFDGTFTLSRPAGLVLPDGKTLANVPWRASGRVKGTSAAALIEQIEVQYGPEERALKLDGNRRSPARRSRPRFDGVLSARQIDVDRSLPSADATRRPPAATLQALADTLSETIRPPLPVQLGISIDNLIFGGAPLQSVRGDVRIEGDTLNLDDFEFRAPGVTQVQTERPAHRRRQDQGPGIRRTGECRIRPIRAPDGLARRPLGYDPAGDRLAARARRRDDRQRADRRRAPARRVRSPPGGRAARLCLSGRQSPGPARRGAQRGRIRRRRGDRLRRQRSRRRVVRPPGRYRAGARFRQGDLCRRRGAHRQGQAQIRRRRPADRADVDRRSRRRRGQCQRPHRYRRRPPRAARSR